MSTGNAAGSIERARERIWGTDIESGYGAVTVALWGLVVGLYALGDTGLTTVVLELGGFEANPVARAFFETAGYAGLVVQKALAVGILWAIWRYYPTVGDLSPDPWRLVVPAIAAARGGQLVALHLQHISILV
jgi:hypothetical protein